MTAPHTTRTSATWIFNGLRHGDTYLATTGHRSITGEYLGMETPHGDWAIMLRHESGTESIALAEVTSIEPMAA